MNHLNTNSETARFGEWSRACCANQLKALHDPGTPTVAWHYMGIFLPEDANMMNNLVGSIRGEFMSKWWDNSSEAGPKRRPRSSFSESCPTLEVLTITGNEPKTFSYGLAKPVCMFPWPF